MPLGTKPGDSFLQHAQGHPVGVSDRQRKPVAVCQLFQAFDFSPNGRAREIAIVEKDIPARHRQLVTTCHLLSHSMAIGTAIDEIHAVKRAQHLHQPAHWLRLTCEGAAHVVVHAFDPGKLSQSKQHGTLEYQAIHPAIEYDRLQCALPVLCLHRQMKHQLSIHVVERLPQPLGFGCIGKNGECNGRIQPGCLHAGRIAVANIVDDQSDLACVHRRGGQQENHGDVIELFHE